MTKFSWKKYQNFQNQKIKSLISISSSPLDTQAQASRSLQFHRTKDSMRPPKRPIHMLTTWVRPRASQGQGVSRHRSRDGGSSPPPLHRQRPRQLIRRCGGRPLDRRRLVPTHPLLRYRFLSLRLHVLHLRHHLRVQVLSCCIVPWLEQHNSCPVCRQELPLQGSSSSSSSTCSCPSSSSRTSSSNSSHRRESGIVGEKEEVILLQSVAISQL